MKISASSNAARAAADPGQKPAPLRLHATAPWRTSGFSSIGHEQTAATHRQADGDQPGNAVGAGFVEDPPAQPGAEKAAQLVAEKDDAGQHRHVAQAEDLRDQAVGQRHRAQPEQAHHGGEDPGCRGQQRHAAGKSGSPRRAARRSAPADSSCCSARRPSRTRTSRRC